MNSNLSHKEKSLINNEINVNIKNDSSFSENEESKYLFDIVSNAKYQNLYYSNLYNPLIYNKKIETQLENTVFLNKKSYKEEADFTTTLIFRNICKKSKIENIQFTYSVLRIIATSFDDYEYLYLPEYIHIESDSIINNNCSIVTIKKKTEFINLNPGQALGIRLSRKMVTNEVNEEEEYTHQEIRIYYLNVRMTIDGKEYTEEIKLV